MKADLNIKFFDNGIAEKIDLVNQAVDCLQKAQQLILQASEIPANIAVEDPQQHSES